MSSIKGKTIVFTGTLDMQRSKASADAINAGAKVTSAISGNTDIVVAGAQAGSKLETAKAKGVAIWTEQQFVKACSGSGGSSAKKVAPAPKKTAAKAAPAPAAKSAAASKGGQWEWYDAEEGSWTDFAAADSSLLETRFVASQFKFTLTKELSFNKKHATPYDVDLMKKVQKNTSSGTTKKLRRMVDGVESYQREAKGAASARGKRDRDTEDDDDDDDEDEEENAKPAKKKAAAPAAKKKASGGASLLQGKTLVFTGTLTMKRALATAKATNAGAKVTGSVSKKTDYLVCGADAGSKEDTAAALGVKVISEAKFLKLADGDDTGGSDDEDDDEDDGEDDDGEGDDDENDAEYALELRKRLRGAGRAFVRTS